MNKKVKTVLLLLLFLLVLGGAAAAYKKLGKSFSPENPLSSPDSASGKKGASSQEATGQEGSEDQDASGQDGSEDQDASGQGGSSQESRPIPVPDFTLTDAQGTELLFSSFQGKPTVVNFWTPWCPYCKDEMPYFQAAYEAYGEQLQLVMLDVPDARNTAQDALDLVQEKGFTFPVYLDVNSESLLTFGVYSYPQTFFFNSKGEFVGRLSGALPSQETLFEIIDSLLELEDGSLLF